MDDQIVEIYSVSRTTPKYVVSGLNKVLLREDEDEVLRMKCNSLILCVAI